MGLPALSRLSSFCSRSVLSSPAIFTPGAIYFSAVAHNAKAIWLLRLRRMVIAVRHRFSLIWQLADMIVACRGTGTNLTAILLLSPVVYTSPAIMLRQRKLGVRPQFDPRRFPDIRHGGRTTGCGIARLNRQSQPIRPTAAFCLKVAENSCKDWIC